MPQHDLDIANAAGNVFRADLNAALVALGTNQKGPTAPAGPAAGWIWIDDNTPSATLWTVFQYDGAAWVTIGFIDSTNDRYYAAGVPIWGGTAGGTANALTVTSTPAPTARFPGLMFNFLAAAANTAAATLNDNGLGAAAIRRPDNSALLPGDVLPGELVQVVWDGTLWRLCAWPASFVKVDQRVASASAQIDIALPAGFTEFELRFVDVRPVTDGATLQLRTTTDNFATVAATAGDYTLTTEFTRPAATDVQSVAVATPAAINLSAGSDVTNAAVTVRGVLRFWIGDGTRLPHFNVESSSLEDAVANLTMLRGMGFRQVATAINGIRLFMSSGNISRGTFKLYGVR
jgi:hypothetical protein